MPPSGDRGKWDGRRPEDRDAGRQTTRALLAGLALELRLSALVEVLDPVDVLDGAPRRPGGPAHGVVERLAQLVFGGTGLLRSREASGHSGRAAGRGHGGQRDQLHGLRIEGAFAVEDAGKLL